MNIEVVVFSFRVLAAAMCSLGITKMNVITLLTFRLIETARTNLFNYTNYHLYLKILISKFPLIVNPDRYACYV